MATKRECVVALLRGYRENQRKIEILRYERKHPAEVSAGEVLEGLALRPPQSSGLPSSNLTGDETMRIATEYQEITRRLNEDYTLGVAMELADLMLTCERLERYIDLLSEERREIIRLRYFEGKSWLQMQEHLKRAKRTLTEINAHAIDELTAMYAYVDILVNAPSEASAPALDFARNVPSP